MPKKMIRERGDRAKRQVLHFRVTEDDYNMIKRAKPKGMFLGEFLRDAVLSKAQEIA